MACSLVIRVVPRAKKQRIQCDSIGQLKVYLTSVPENGAANSELIALLAELLKIPRNAIVIASGSSSRIKRIVIDSPLALDEIYERCGIVVQRALF